MMDKETERYIRANYPAGDIKEMAEKLGCTINSLRKRAGRLGIQRQRKWDREKEDKLRRLYADTSNEELAVMFGTTKSAVGAKARELGVTKSREFILAHVHKTCFRKGHVPATKGKKQSDYMSDEAIERVKAGWFRKGCVPANAKPIGSEIITKCGYRMVRTERGFVAKHVKLWEDAYGKVPKGFLVAFKDGNKDNITLDNLELITKSENMRRNSVCRYPAELRTVIRTVGMLNRKINQITNSKNGES